MNPSQFVTAKEIAPIVELTDRSIRQPHVQRRLGIHDCRDGGCNKPIRFRRQEVRQRLSSRGYNTTGL